MPASDDVFERRNTRLHESLVHILSHTSRRRTIERQVATFGADHELSARDAVLVREYLQRFADRALASLKTIVGRGIDDVNAKLHRANDRVRVAEIRSFVRIAEISANTDRGKYQTVLLAEVIRRETIGKAFAIEGRALRCCAFSCHSERMLTGYVRL